MQNTGSRILIGSAMSALLSLNHLRNGGAEGIRTPDPHNAIVVLYQLSYDPNPSACNLVSRSALSKHFAGRKSRFGSTEFTLRIGTI